MSNWCDGLLHARPVRRRRSRCLERRIRPDQALAFGCGGNKCGPTRKATGPTRDAHRAATLVCVHYHHVSTRCRVPWDGEAAAAADPAAWHSAGGRQYGVLHLCEGEIHKIRVIRRNVQYRVSRAARRAIRFRHRRGAPRVDKSAEKPTLAPVLLSPWPCGCHVDVNSMALA